MSQPVPTLANRLCVGLGSLAVVAAACLAVPGCANTNVRDDGFKENELSSFCRKLRPEDNSIQPFAFSNKAQQIERGLGAR